MRRVLLWLLPREWRDRYGAELVDALDADNHRIRNTLDVVAAAAALRCERAIPGREQPVRRFLLLVSTILLALGTAGAVWSATELANGFADIPQHWWSALAASPLVAGLALGAAVLSRSHLRLR